MPNSPETREQREIALDYELGCYFCHIVWAFKPGDLQVVAICSTAEKAARYVENGRTLFPGHTLAADRAPIDHLFGASDLRSVAFRASQRRDRRGDYP